MSASILDPQPINRYPDEPHPNDEWEWKKWWVQKMYPQGGMVLVQWVDNCWNETKARWCIKPATKL